MFFIDRLHVVYECSSTLISVIYIIWPKIYIISCLETNVQFNGIVLTGLNSGNVPFVKLALEVSLW